MLDDTALQRLRDLDPSGQTRLLERVLQAFEASVARLLPQLREARARGDMQAVGQVAHTFKSSAASIGATELARLCAGIEQSVRSRGVEALPAMLDDAEREFDNVLRALRSHLGADR